jgi:hypothetical protein
VPPLTVTFRLFPQVRHSAKRAIGLLEGSAELNVWATFEKLKPNQRRHFLTSMDLWLSGKHGPVSRFHGWPNDQECRMCFVFKHQDRRFYGFIYHPQPVSNGSLQICVLCSSVPKHEWASDRRVLLRVRDWYLADSARKAVKVLYPDEAK